MRTTWAAPKGPKGPKPPKGPKAGPKAPKGPKPKLKAPKLKPPKLVKPPGKRPVIVKPGRPIIHKGPRPIVVKPGGPIVVAPPAGLVLPPPPAGKVEIVLRGKKEYVEIPAWTGELKQGQMYTCSRYVASTGRHQVLLYTQDPTANFDVYVRNPHGRVFASGEEPGGECVQYDLMLPGQLTYEVVAKQGEGLFMLKLD